jgi:hypothetical protein
MLFLMNYKYISWRNMKYHVNSTICPFLFFSFVTFDLSFVVLLSFWLVLTYELENGILCVDKMRVNCYTLQTFMENFILIWCLNQEICISAPEVVIAYHTLNNLVTGVPNLHGRSNTSPFSVFLGRLLKVITKPLLDAVHSCQGPKLPGIGS